MNFKNFLKTSLCAIGLGVSIIGINSMAMEVETETKNEIVTKSKYEGAKGQMGQDIYKEYCKRLSERKYLTQDLIKKESALFVEMLLEGGRSAEYSAYYARLVVEHKLDRTMAWRRAEIYEQALKKNRGRIYADYFSEMTVEGRYPNEIADRLADLYTYKMEEGKGKTYSSKYANLIVFESVLPDIAEFRLDLIEKEGVGELYAEHYADLIFESVPVNIARKRAAIFEMTILEEKRSKVYAAYYAKTLVEDMEKKMKHMNLEQPICDYDGVY